MDELEKTMPDDFWRKAFENAAETPPPRVWNAIEHQLDESDGARVLPLWATGLVSSKPVAWTMGIAASVALVLVGWWLLSLPSNTQSAMVAHQTSANIPNKRLQSGSVNTSNNGAHSPAEQSLAATEPINRVTTSIPTEQRASPKMTTVQPGSGSSVAKAGWTAEHKSLLESRMAIAPTSHQSASILAKTGLPSSVDGRFASASFVNTGYSVTSLPSNQVVNRAVFEPVAGKGPMYSSRYGQIHRIVWFQPSESSVAPEAVKAKRKSRDVWASASVMPGSYNPMVSIHTTSVFANNYVALDAIKNNQLNNSAQQSISSRPNFSMAYQASAGVQLTDRWSVESGVGYLVGRSTVETPAQLAIASFVSSTARTSATNTLYTDIIRNSALADQMPSAVVPSAYNSSTALANQAVYSAQTRQTITNDYQFVQVPVQVGYQLRPRKRLSLALLGGFITNIFVRNTVGEELLVTPKDGIYKPVTLAATMGARLRYRPSRQWSASFAGVYQPTLSSGTSSDTQVQTHPTAAGMSVGVDYHF